MSEVRFPWTLTALPADPNFVPTGEVAQACLALFQGIVPASEHEVECFDEPRFFGGELFSSTARCPVCAAVVQRGNTPGTANRQWFAEVDALGAHRRAASTPVTMPECGHTVPISNVAFGDAAGTARFALTAHFDIWWEEWDDEDPQLPAEPLKAFSACMGTTLCFVRSLPSLLPADRCTIEKLLSTDDAARLEAANTLEALPAGHFDDYSIAGIFIEDHADALLAAWHGTAHASVRRWVLILFGDANYSGEGLRDAVESELQRSDGLTEMALYVCHRERGGVMRSLAPLIRRCHTHHDARVRWRCALSLGNLPADDPEDRSAIRALALDPGYSVRVAALSAMKTWIRKQGGIVADEDRAVLKSVLERFPDDHLARELLS